MGNKLWCKDRLNPFHTLSQSLSPQLRVPSEEIWGLRVTGTMRFSCAFECSAWIPVQTQHITFLWPTLCSGPNVHAHAEVTSRHLHIYLKQGMEGTKRGGCEGSPHCGWRTFESLSPGLFVLPQVGLRFVGILNSNCPHCPL